MRTEWIIFAAMKMENQEQNENWFASWFDSAYYPLLYRHRNEEEARTALQNLSAFLELPKGSYVLDLCCGQGRHARTLCELGYTVTGIDLSPSSIAEAERLAQGKQQFFIQDMRTFDVNQRFDAVFNLFTSFGYFVNRADNLDVLSRIATHLHSQGTLVIDYLNAFPLFSQSEQENHLLVDGISFYTRKLREGDFIVKHIEVKDGDKVQHFRERVQLITLEHFQVMLNETGFEIEHTFGDYHLREYDPETSERCIIIARKS